MRNSCLRHAQTHALQSRKHFLQMRHFRNVVHDAQRNAIQPGLAHTAKMICNVIVRTKDRIGADAADQAPLQRIHILVATFPPLHSDARGVFSCGPVTVFVDDVMIKLVGLFAGRTADGVTAAENACFAAKFA